MVRLANRLLQGLGLHVNRFGYAHKPFIDEQFSEIYRRNRDKTMISWEGVYDTYNAAKYVAHHGIAGDIVECGVWRGGSAIAIAETLNVCQCTDKKIFMYDTFSGMPKPDERDSALKTGQAAFSNWQKSQKNDHNSWAYASLDEVKGNARKASYPFENFVFVQGKVEDTIPATIPSEISLLRLDTDWYESTLHEMEHLFPKLSIGGVLIVDDYGVYKGARDATNEYFMKHDKRIFFQYNYSYGAAIGVKISQ